MNDWFKTASATFGGGALAIALVAIPTFVWLPREFDKIYVEASGAQDASKAAQAASEEAKIASDSTLAQIDGLVVSIARMDAKPVVDFSIKSDSGAFQMSLGGGNAEIFNVLFPPDVAEIIKNSGKTSDFKYSNFGGGNWVFVDEASFNEFTLEEQKLIETSLERKSARFYKD